MHASQYQESIHLAYYIAEFPRKFGIGVGIERMRSGDGIILEINSPSPRVKKRVQGAAAMTVRPGV